MGLAPLAAHWNPENLPGRGFATLFRDERPHGAETNQPLGSQDQPTCRPPNKCTRTSKIIQLWTSPQPTSAMGESPAGPPDQSSPKDPQNCKLSKMPIALNHYGSAFFSFIAENPKRYRQGDEINFVKCQNPGHLNSQPSPLITLLSHIFEPQGPHV